MRILPLAESFPELNPSERLEKIFREVNAIEPEDEINAIGGMIYLEEDE